MTECVQLLNELAGLARNPEELSDQKLLAIIRRIASDIVSIESVLDKIKSLGAQLDQRARHLKNLESVVTNHATALHAQLSDTVEGKVAQIDCVVGSMARKLDEDKMSLVAKFTELEEKRAKRDLFLDREVLHLNESLDQIHQQHFPQVHIRAASHTDELEKANQRIQLLSNENAAFKREMDSLLKRLESVEKRAFATPTPVEPQPAPDPVPVARDVKTAQPVAQDQYADQKRVLDEARDIVESRVVYGIGDPNVPDDPVLTWQGVTLQLFTTAHVASGILATDPFVEAAAKIKAMAKVGDVLRIDDLYQWLKSNCETSAQLNLAVLAQLLMKHYRIVQDSMNRALSPRSRVSRRVKDIERDERKQLHRV